MEQRTGSSVRYTEGADYGDGSIVWEEPSDYYEHCEFLVTRGHMYVTLWPNNGPYRNVQELLADLEPVRQLKLSPDDAIKAMKTGELVVIEDYGEPVERDGKQAQRYEKIEMRGYVFISVGNRVRPIRAVEKKFYKKLWRNAAKETNND